MFYRSLSMFVIVATLASSGFAMALVNPSFEDPAAGTSIGDSVFVNNVGPGLSAADGWTVFNNSLSPSTETSLHLYGSSLAVPPPPPVAGTGDALIRVETNSASNGLVQVLGPLNSGPTSATASVWVYVDAGVAGLGIGNGGATSLTAFSQSTGTWELLTTSTISGSPAVFNEIIVYSSGGSAQFWVDVASIVPEPTSFMTLCLAGAGLVARPRRSTRV